MRKQIVVNEDQLIERRVVRLRRTWGSAAAFTHLGGIRIGYDMSTTVFRTGVIRRADYDDLQVLITVLKLRAGRRSRMHHRKMEYLFEMVRISYRKTLRTAYST